MSKDLKVSRDHRGSRVRRESPALKGSRGHRGSQGHRAQLAPKARPGREVRLDLRVSRAHKVSLGSAELKVSRGSPTLRSSPPTSPLMKFLRPQSLRRSRAPTLMS